MSGTPEHDAFLNAKGRCTNPKNDAWLSYGGRGIRFLFTSFENFYLELGPRPGPEFSLDRVNPNGDYCASNCKWGTRVEQANHKRNQWIVTYEEPDYDLGETSYRVHATMYF
jgi:hypothetical protein